MVETNRRSKKRAPSFLLALLLTVSIAAGLLACAPAALSPPLIPIKAPLPWTHQAHFVGLYAAAQNGDYNLAEFYNGQGTDVYTLQFLPEIYKP